MSGWKYALALSKQDVLTATPPGTVRLLAEDESTTRSLRSSNSLIRFPQPSEDPADPLNWAQWRKFGLLLTVSLYSFVGNFTSSGIAPALSLWFKEFPHDVRPFSDLSYFIAVNVLFLGASNIWWVPLSNIFGRRPVLLVATLIMTVCTVWCAVSSSYSSVLAARLFQGIGAGASESVAPALIGEVFFVDERGRAMAIYTVFLASGSLIGGIAGGYIGYDVGWAYIFWVGVALSAACFVGTLFLVPETLYDRIVPSIDSPGGSQCEEKGTESHLEDTRSRTLDYRPYTYGRSLGFTHYRGNVVSHFLAPWKTLRFPGTWVVMFHYAGLVGGIVTISTVGPQIMAAPPYLWGANAGLINVGGIIGTILGALYTYFLSDKQLKRKVKTSGSGFAEAESRLPTMFLSLGISTGGFFVFGFTGQYPSRAGWVGLCVGFAMVSFGLMQLPSIGFNYIIDAYQHHASDCFVMVTIMRAIIAFAWTFFVAEWVEKKGTAEPFGIFGMLMGLFSLLTVPLWLYGKRMRIATRDLVEK
ncbi:major facilitator superfamily transporter [Colletotrichum higginsianum]|uniref:Major facilitator superfamily transporter n=1 Tax=Colletotrichum higginsianum (strain IMI 349063) TaxID=759273 RepID=H1VSA9_COLHI|nr:Major facilitator superfamily transporter [Colletotrichum higginsianum IMI 349063]OBR02649.1 Major facilitator superfamily transporter [Colletotrichum higginsianum IMI 349063]GJD00616.1 major facilitator superfamily transporter [Colletotrichum higginsianum]CCF43117.1 major facilitator superfamily transporter [Colletotrichum higginsianum]